MSARSPGTITSVPSTRSSRKCSTLIAATRTARTSRWSLASAPARTSASSSAATCDTVGWPSAGSSGRTYSGWRGRRLTECARISASSIAGHPVDDHAEQRGALARQLRAGDPHRRGDLGDRGASDHDQQRAAEMVGQGRVELEVERRQTPAKSVPSQTITSKRWLQPLVGVEHAAASSSAWRPAAIIACASGRSTACISSYDESSR